MKLWMRCYLTYSDMSFELVIIFKKKNNDAKAIIKRSDYFLGWPNVVICNQIVHKDKDPS